VEKEIFPGNSFSTHHGYRLKKTLQPEGSKLHQIEKKIFEKLFDIDFSCVFLNMSIRGFAVSVCMAGHESEKSLNKIESNFNFKIQRREWFNGFSIFVDDLDKDNFIHREFYPKPDLRYMNLDKETIACITDLRLEFKSSFICLTMNCTNEEVLKDEVHLELYFNKEEEDMQHMLHILQTKYQIDVNKFSDKLKDVNKFSHLKLVIKNGEINKIKYYRSLNVLLPDYFYVEPIIYI